MKYSITLLILMAISLSSTAQCHIRPSGQTIQTTSDTTIDLGAFTGGTVNAIMPCPGTHLTVTKDSSTGFIPIDTIYIRPGAKLTFGNAVSPFLTSTLTGLYVDSGGTIDFNNVSTATWNNVNIWINSNAIVQNNSSITYTPSCITQYTYDYSLVSFNISACTPLAVTDFPKSLDTKLINKPSNWELNDLSDNVSWKLYDISGRVVSEGDARYGKIKIPKDRLFKGIYLIRLSFDNRIETIKVIN